MAGNSKGCLYVHAFELPDCRILDDDIYDDAKSVDRCDRKIVKAIRKDKGAGSRFCDDDVLGAAFYPEVQGADAGRLRGAGVHRA